MVSLRRLTLFLDFEEAQRANWGQACLAYLYSTLDSLSMWGLGRSLKLVIFSFFALYLVACTLANCVISKTVILQTAILHLTCGLYFFVFFVFLFFCFVLFLFLFCFVFIFVFFYIVLWLPE